MSWPRILIAVFDNDIKAVEAELNDGVDIECADATHCTWTPLLAASWVGYVPIAKLLLERRANVNKGSSYRYTPLHNAAAHGHIAVVKCLLDSHAEINAPSLNGETPLMNAARGNWDHVVMELLARGADFSLQNTSGKTAFDRAFAGGQVKCLETLEMARKFALDRFIQS
jgi:hypothetical protein